MFPRSSINDLLFVCLFIFSYWLYYSGASLVDIRLPTRSQGKTSTSVGRRLERPGTEVVSIRFDFVSSIVFYSY